MRGKREAFAALVAAEKDSVNAVKERARNVFFIDQATGGTKLKELQQHLKTKGVTLTDNRASRARNIGRLLYQLDTENLDPSELAHITHEGTLYQLARIADKGGDVEESLALIV